MGVVDLERVRVERLVPGIVAELQAAGVARAAIAEVGGLDRWRRSARLAGQRLGWHIQTGVSADLVWAVSDDYKPHWNADRAAANRVAALIFGLSCDGR